MGTACAVACANVQDADASIILGSTIAINQVPGVTETEVAVSGWKAGPTTEVGVQTDKVIISDFIDSKVPSPDFSPFGL